MNRPLLTDILNIKYPIIMAPMFLVSNTAMVIEALESGITAAIPSLNYRNTTELAAAIDEIKNKSDKPFGINIIVNKSNLNYREHLNVCIDKHVDFIITSLGNPKEVITACKPHGIKVFCDVINAAHAQKVESLGADVLIAVTSDAGGHCGPKSADVLIPELLSASTLPVIGAGGVSTPEDIAHYMSLGASGVSVGTIFIASTESPVSNEYKETLVQYGADDIVITTKISGTHLTVVNTPYVQKNGLEATWLEKLLRYKPLKKWAKLLINMRGMNMIRKGKDATYNTYFVAGKSIENVHCIRPVKEIIKNLVH